MTGVKIVCTALILVFATTSMASANNSRTWPANLPRYDHIVIVIEENKDFDEIIGQMEAAPYINKLASEGASLTRMFGEEHESEGNYFWLFSGSDQHVGQYDKVPTEPINASNLGEQLLNKGLSFKGYSESLPAIGSRQLVVPAGCAHLFNCIYGRKHVPWISFSNIPNGATVETSSNLRWSDFPANYASLPTVAFVIPNLIHDMHNGKAAASIPAGDLWLARNLDPYYQWAKLHNSLLIITFDESDDKTGKHELTDPASNPDRSQDSKDLQNRIATIFAGAHVKRGYAEIKAATHVNILRTIEAMYGLQQSGAQQANAARAGIDEMPITGVFKTIR